MFWRVGWVLCWIGIRLGFCLRLRLAIRPFLLGLLGVGVAFVVEWWRRVARGQQLVVSSR